MPIDGFEIPKSEKVEVKKNITSEILGKQEDVIDFDTRMPQSDFKPVSDNGILQQDLQQDNALVNVLDLFISTSPMILKKYDYPAPDLSIWKEWGKPNLNICFNHYMPAGSGTAVASPIMAGIVGVAAMGMTMLPVILEFIKRRKEAAKEAALQPPEGVPEDAQIPEDQVAAPVQVEPEPEPMDTSTADVSEHQLTVTERMAEMEQQIV